MYINYCDYQTSIFDQIGKSSIKQRVSQYFVDLYDRYQADLNIDMSASVYNCESSYQYYLTNHNVMHFFKEADYLFFPSWGFNFDSQFAVPELYLKNHFNLSGSIIDIRDCGKLCVFQSIQLLLKLHDKEKVKSSVCFSVENQFPWRVNSAQFTYPNINYVGLIVLSTDIKSNSTFSILHCDIVKYSTAFDDIILESINKISRDFGIEKEAYLIYLNDQTKQNKNSSGFLYFALNHFSKKHQNNLPNYIFIVDADPVEEAFGIVLIQKVER